MMFGGMACWGPWSSIQKLTTNWRSELSYCDFAFGLCTAGALVATTLVTLFGPLTCWGNLAGADRKVILLTVLPGVIRNAVNVLLVNCLVLARIAVVSPIAIGLALVLTTIRGFFVMPRGNTMLVAAGVTFAFAAGTTDSLAYSSAATERKHHTNGSWCSYRKVFFLLPWSPWRARRYLAGLN
jgi:hypothetical protein